MWYVWDRHWSSKNFISKFCLTGLFFTGPCISEDFMLKKYIFLYLWLTSQPMTGNGYTLVWYVWFQYEYALPDRGHGSIVYWRSVLLSINGIENPNGLSRNNGTTGHTKYSTKTNETKSSEDEQDGSTKIKPGEKLTKYWFISGYRFNKKS